MKKISSWFEVVTVRRLNRLPRAGILPSKGTCCTFIELLVWMTPPITTVPLGDQDLRGRLLGDECRVALHRTAEVRRRVLDVDVQEDGAFRGDLRNDRQPQERIHVADRRGTAQLSLGHDRHAHALADQSLDVVLRDHARTRQNLQQSA